MARKVKSQEYVDSPLGTDAQPVSRVQWVDRELLHANHYNPNHVAPPERELLVRSIMEDGWTQPIVARSDYEIVDGFHRFMVSADPRLMKMTDGKVPVVFLNPADMAHQMMSTIRHNRARGHHAVLKMAEIARTLVGEHGMDAHTLGDRLGMEEEEVDRLTDTHGMIKRGANPDLQFNKGWVPE